MELVGFDFFIIKFEENTVLERNSFMSYEIYGKWFIMPNKIRTNDREPKCYITYAEVFKQMTDYDSLKVNYEKKSTLPTLMPKNNCPFCTQ